MRKRRKSKPYQSQYLDLLAKLIGIMLVYYFILSRVPESFASNIFTAVIVPVVMAIFGFGVGRIDKSNADVDIKIHRDPNTILGISSPIWLIPKLHYIATEMQLLEVTNIGETMISSVSLVFGKAKGKGDQAFQVAYPLHKKESIYIGIDTEIDIVNVVYISYGFDEAITFQGEKIRIASYQTFAERIRSTQKMKLKRKEIVACKRASLEQMICSETSITQSGGC